VTHGSRTMRRLTPIVLALLCTGCSPFLYLLVRLRDRGGAGGRLSLGQTVTGSNSGGSGRFSPTCGGRHENSDSEWTFVAPASDTYQFTTSADYDCVLAVYRDTEQLGCNDDTGDTRHSLVNVALERGQSYSVVVDGYQAAVGNYSLSVRRGTDVPPGTIRPDVPTLPPPQQQVADTTAMAARCESAPVLPLGSSHGVIESNTATARTSCGNGGPGGDVVYRFDAPGSGLLVVREASDFDAVLELRSACTGSPPPVFVCNDDSSDTRHAMVSAPVTQGANYLVVDSYAAAGEGPFALEVGFVPDPLSPSEAAAAREESGEGDSLATGEGADAADAAIDASTDVLLHRGTRHPRPR
jgi:hypothetical protein